ncbi:hypothetical protein HYQ45_013502 [Verticillium longisporum]|uniref:Fatty acid hydroxylase domain-containing protein n=1 Tax=Verticillium longisporum TaxID=100787 RepID=A0A8I2ZDX8_VERLO|nr:hypothetical protein HYQ45_013502 [Verticillium longisporum]
MMNILAHLALLSLGNVAVRAFPQAYNEYETPSTVTFLCTMFGKLCFLRCGIFCHRHRDAQYGRVHAAHHLVDPNVWSG